MTVSLEPLHRHLDFVAPLSDGRAKELVAFLAARATGMVLDAGCGWAELLVRLLRVRADLRGIGLDLRDDFSHAWTNATRWGVADRLDLIAGDAKGYMPEAAGGAICIGASQIWGPPVDARQPLDYRAALKALRRVLSPGAPLVYGEAIWSRPPTEAAAAPLARRLDEFVFLPDLVDMAWSCGFTVARVHEASLDEWDRFESGYAASWATWLANHPGSHPDASAVREDSRRHRDAYFRGYRGILGMAYLALIAA
jgi:cyclopropane fatty-acyl-phospholipid synthase-like methyltransferase